MTYATEFGLRAALAPMRRAGAVALLSLVAARVQAQVPANLAAERAAFSEWLAQAPVSPYRALAVLPVDPGGAVLPMDGPVRKLVERGAAVWLEGNGPARVLPRDRPVTLGNNRIVVSGDPGRVHALLFGPPVKAAAPAYYAYDPSLVFTGAIARPSAPRNERVLLADGTEVTATDAGTVDVDVGGKTRLRVLRLPDPSPDETTLQIYFRDASSGAGSYPAGRFVTLEPAGNGRWRLDFNRARNPFCAYNAAYPCPAPWRGNSLAGAVRAGERYESH